MSTLNEEQQTQPAAPIDDGRPYFLGGNEQLIKFDGINAYLLVDPKTQTIRPFISDEALRNYYGPNYQREKSRADLNPIAAPEVDENNELLGGVFEGYNVLGTNYAVQNDGSSKVLDYSPSQLKARYGKTINEQAEVDNAFMLNASVTYLKNLESQTGISGNFVTSLLQEPGVREFYLSALTYGEYTVADIFSDIKRRNLVNQGRTDLDNIQVISSTLPKSQYRATDEGARAATNPDLTLPTRIGDIDANIFNLPVYQLPDEVFKTLVPHLRPGTPEFQEAVDAVEASYYDILNQQLQATTEQEQAVANYNYNQLKSYVEENLGIQLSANAIQAYDQIKSIQKQSGALGLEGSGFQTEAIDEHLKRVRLEDEQKRSQSKNTADSNRAVYYTSYATPEEVEQLVQTEPDTAKQWGLIPSDEVKQAFDFNTLKARFPKLSDEQINNYIASVLDEHGNYRSGIYQRQAASVLQNQQAEKEFREGTALQQGLNKEAKAYRAYDPTSPFLRDAEPSDVKTSVGGKQGALDIPDALKNLKEPVFPQQTTPSPAPAPTSTTKSTIQPVVPKPSVIPSTFGGADYLSQRPPAQPIQKTASNFTPTSLSSTNFTPVQSNYTPLVPSTQFTPTKISTPALNYNPYTPPENNTKNISTSVSTDIIGNLWNKAKSFTSSWF